MSGAAGAGAAPPSRVRDTTLDVAKGLLILVVVFVHNPLLLRGAGLLQQVVYSFPLPMFFMISGVFFRPGMEAGALLRTRASALLKPYFVMLSALAAVKWLRQWLLPGSEVVVDGRYLLGIVYGNGPTIDWTPLWYLPSLFVTSVAGGWVLRRLAGCSRASLAMVATLLLAFGVWLLQQLWPAGICAPGTAQAWPGWPWSLDLLPITVAYLLFGYVLGPWVRTFRFSIAGALLALALCCFLHARFDSVLDLNCRSYGRPWVSTLMALSGSYLVLSVAWLLARFSVLGRLFAYIGGGTIFILLFHAFIAKSAIAALSPLLPTFVAAGATFVAAALGPLAVMAMTRRSTLLRALLLPVASRGHG